jgi:2-keto-4-pentenoate hydratase/2-oxohepta-3-ene-1,7-dioic acid hydratase in catechol pathway
VIAVAGSRFGEHKRGARACALAGVKGLDPATMETAIRVNSRETDRFATNTMILDTATYIAELSKYCAIVPGDVMRTGTDGMPQNFKPGDGVEIGITGIGVPRKKVVAQ